MSLLAAPRPPGRLGANATGVNASLYGVDCLSTGIFTGAAGLGADAAMGMHLGMAAALLRTGRTGARAGFDKPLQHLGVAPRAADGGLPRGQADIGTILVQPDALAKLIHHGLAQAGIGAGDAGLGAVEAGLDAGDQGLVRFAVRMRVGFDHGSNGYRLRLLLLLVTGSKPEVARSVPHP